MGSCGSDLSLQSFFWPSNAVTPSFVAICPVWDTRKFFSLPEHLIWASFPSSARVFLLPVSCKGIISWGFSLSLSGIEDLLPGGKAGLLTSASSHLPSVVISWKEELGLKQEIWNLSSKNSYSLDKGLYILFSSLWICFNLLHLFFQMCVSNLNVVHIHFRL